MKSNAPTSKIQIPASMSPKLVTQILLKSIAKCVSYDMFIIFFGYVIAKNLIVQDCIQNMAWRLNLIEFYKKSIFHGFCMKLNASTLKIQISGSKFPNFVIQFLLKSTTKCLSNDVFIIFFGYVVVNNSILEDCFPNMKWHQK